MSIYCINKGWHYSTIVPSFHCGVKSMSRYVTFDKSCLYELTNLDCIKDINKLFGFSYGMHKNNSMRFGWRCIDGITIQIFAYNYTDRERKQRLLCSVAPGEKYLFSINYQTEENICTFKVLPLGLGSPSMYTFSCDVPPACGYYLYPYFGGDCAAPHSMCITLE
jgi:hypothetical protein